MGSLSIQETQSQLEHKFGFTRRESKDTMFELWVAGKKVASTKTSHKGSNKGEIGPKRQSEMADQTNMPSGYCFFEGVKCRYSKRKYFEHLATVHPDHATAILDAVKGES